MSALPNTTTAERRAGLQWALRVCAIASAVGLFGLAWIIAARVAPAVVPMPAGWFRAAVMILASGAIGFGTNWLAIKMLFRPYRARRWLAVWPQGLLPREQGRFARALGHVAAERLLSPEAIAQSLADERLAKPLAEELRRTAEGILADPETRRILAAATAEAVRAHGPSLVKAMRPAIRAELRRVLDDRFTADGVLVVVEGALLRFAQATEMRRSLARWLFRETSREGVVTRIMGAVEEQFFRFRERNPLRGFLIEQFVVDWDGLRNGLVEMLQSDEAVEDLAGVLVELTGGVLERLRAPEAAEAIASLRDHLVERLLDWIEKDGIAYLADKMGTLAVEGEGREALAAALDDLARRVPAALSDASGETLRPEFARHVEELRHRVVSSFPVAEIVERQVMAMEPARIERLVDEAGRRELAWIQILGLVLGMLAGVALLAV